MSSIKGVPAMDVLPEYFPYRDDGCDVSASCLACPLPTCKYDDPDRFHRERRAHRDQQVMEARLRDGVTIIELSRRFQISQRTVHRILARGDPMQNSNTRATRAYMPFSRDLNPTSVKAQTPR
ncbi:MAG: hypothetical protein V1724_04625 [Chloroflexota bacterium]